MCQRVCRKRVLDEGRPAIGGMLQVDVSPRCRGGAYDARSADSGYPPRWNRLEADSIYSPFASDHHRRHATLLLVARPAAHDSNKQPHQAFAISSTPST